MEEPDRAASSDNQTSLQKDESPPLSPPGSPGLRIEPHPDTTFFPPPLPDAPEFVPVPLDLPRFAASSRIMPYCNKLVLSLVEAAMLRPLVNELLDQH